VRQFYVEVRDGQPLQPGQVADLSPDESHHLSTVLRGGRDPVLNLTDGRGHRYTARPAGGGRRTVQLEILTVSVDNEEVAPPLLVLACAVVKGKRFEWLLEKAVEMGVHRVLPVVAELGVIEPGTGRQQRWATIMKSALKQSGRCWLPELEEPASLADGLSRPEGALTLFGAVPGEAAGAVPWTDLLAVPPPQPAVSRNSDLAVFIGPEGGWSPAELATLAASDAVPVSFGPHVLRTETAAVAGLAALQALRGAWRISGSFSS
jgi:16S rRNA (uracil1498-N3)-methyltransferase